MDSNCIELVLEYLGPADLRRAREARLWSGHLDNFQMFYRMQKELFGVVVRIEYQDWHRYDTDWLAVWEDLVARMDLTKRTCSVCRDGFRKKLNEWGEQYNTTRYRFVWDPHCNNLTCAQYSRSGTFGSKKGNPYEYGWF